MKDTQNMYHRYFYKRARQGIHVFYLNLFRKEYNATFGGEHGTETWHAVLGRHQANTNTTK